MRYIGGLTILNIALIGLYPLYHYLMAGICYLRAENFWHEGYYSLAIEYMKKADSCASMDYRIKKELGKFYYRLACLKKNAKEAWPLIIKSKEYYEKANYLAPSDAQTAYGIARAGFSLEAQDGSFDPARDNGAYNTLSWFEEAIRLRPCSVTFRYAMVRYLFYHGDNRLLNAVQETARVYPLSYFYLKKEKFWSQTVKESVKKGLEQAVKEKTSLRESHRVLSSFFEDGKEWESAIFHFKQSLQYRSFGNKAEDFIRLGLLYIKKKDFNNAEINFIKALNMSQDRKEDLERIYNIYKKEAFFDEFFRLYNQTWSRFVVAHDMDILLAMSMMDQKRWNDAKDLLIKANGKKPTAGAYYWLASIAEAEKEWDNMELYIQKATVMEPENSNYHVMFSRVLKRLKKLERAEEEAGLAIKFEKKPSPWTFNQRAEIRFEKKNYEGALEDWAMAIRLKTDRASFFAGAAEACLQLGYWQRAAGYYEKAIQFDPENKRYMQRYKELIK